MKNRLLVSLPLSLFFLSLSSPVFAQQPTIYIPRPTGFLPDIGSVISGLIGWLLIVAFILAFIFLVLGGVSWITSGGDKAQVEAARNKIIAAVIGLLIVASAWAIFAIIGGAIGFNPLEGGFAWPKLYPTQ